MDSLLTWIKTLINASGNPELILEIICLAGIVIAAANVFFGYRLSGLWAALLGAAAGAAIGFWAGRLFTRSLTIQLVCLAVGAVLLLLFCRHFRRLSVCVLAGVMTGTLVSSLLSQWSVTAAAGPTAVLAISVAAALFAAVLAGFHQKPVLIVCTSAGGAYTAVSTTVSLFSLYFDREIYWGVILGAAAVGILFQALTTRRFRRR